MIERKSYIPFGDTPDYSIDYLLGILEDARVTTLQRIEHISQDELHWQYDEGWNTIGALLSHLISAGHFFRIHFIEERKLTKEENNKYLPGLEMGKYIPQLISNQHIDEYLKQLANSRLKLVEAIKQLSTSDFHKKRAGYNPNTGHNLAWTLYHVAEDEIHHRGQISILRKLYKTPHNQR